MDQATQKLFEDIFQEAHVVDFDFSKWDRYVRLVVVGGLVSENFAGRGPLHCVDFWDVEEIAWRSTHTHVELESPAHHCQWVVMDFDLIIEDDINVIYLHSVVPPCPEIKIKCHNIDISEMDPKVVDEVNPNWNKPYCPLARPSFQELLKRIRGH